MALPNKTFWVNYNARNYNSTTLTIPKENGQLFNEDLVLPGSVTFTDDHIAITGDKRIHFTFNNTSDNIFNRTINTANVTIIAKVSPTNSTWFFSNRNGNSAVGMLVGLGRKYQMSWTGDDNAYTSSTSPMIFTWRCGNGTQQYIAHSDNVTGTPYTTTAWVGQEANNVYFFGGNIGSESWAGDFYWLYMSPETLTDAEIQQVIVYNDHLHTFSISKSNARFETTGGTETVEIEAETSWTASTPSFVSVSPSTGDTGTTQVTISCPSYTGETRREDVITFTDNDDYTLTFKARQNGNSAGFSNIYLGDNNLLSNTIYLGDNAVNTIYLGEEIIYSNGPFVGLKAAPQSLTLTNLANTANITIRSSEDWTITDDSGGWLSYSTTTGTTGKTVVTVTASTTQAERTATITVTSANYSATVGVSDKARLYLVPNDEIWYHQTGNNPIYPMRDYNQGNTWWVETDMTTSCYIISNTYDSNDGWWKIKWSGPLGRTTGTGFGQGFAAAMTEVMMPETMKREETHNWTYSTNLKKICYGASMESFAERVFNYMYLENIYIYAETCPTFTRPNTQWEYYGGTGVTLHYPAGSDYSSFPLPPNSTRIGDL